MPVECLGEPDKMPVECVDDMDKMPVARASDLDKMPVAWAIRSAVGLPGTSCTVPIQGRPETR